MKRIKIVDFTIAHVCDAECLAWERYQLERRFSPALPEELPPLCLEEFAENGMGVAALDGRELAGYLCSVPPFERAFRSTQAVGAFSPMHANAARERDHAQIYERMLAAAQERWARAGATSHALCLYAHDEAAQRLCFTLGFGMRCFDGIRPMAGLTDLSRPPEGVCLARIDAAQWEAVYPLSVALVEHLAASPCFIRRAPETPEAFAAGLARPDARCFAAFEGGRAVAFLHLSERTGETLAAAAPRTQNIEGAYCLPEYRGTGLFPALLDAAIRELAGEGYARMGVDGESINPAARRFWPKYFQVYTHSVTRRIDSATTKNLYVSLA